MSLDYEYCRIIKLQVHQATVAAMYWDGCARERALVNNLPYIALLTFLPEPIREDETIKIVESV